MVFMRGIIALFEVGRIDLATCADFVGKYAGKWWDRVRVYPRFSGNADHGGVWTAAAMATHHTSRIAVR
jgi:hypothetical protein